MLYIGLSAMSLCVFPQGFMNKHAGWALEQVGNEWWEFLPMLFEPGLAPAGSNSFPRMHRKSSLFMRLFMHVELDWWQLFVSCLNWTLQQSENVWLHSSKGMGQSASRDKTNKSIYDIILSYSIYFLIFYWQTRALPFGLLGKHMTLIAQSQWLFQQRHLLKLEPRSDLQWACNWSSLTCVMDVAFWGWKNIFAQLVYYLIGKF